MPDHAPDPVQKHRAAIDRIDAQLLELLNERARHALAIGRIKKQRNEAIRVPEREDAVLARLRELNRGPLAEEALSGVFTTIFATMRELEHHLPEGEEETAEAE